MDVLDERETEGPEQGSRQEETDERRLTQHVEEVRGAEGREEDQRQGPEKRGSLHAPIMRDPGSLVASRRPPMASGSRTAAPAGREWFGHPRGLSTLFFTEMWERFSYYGMRGILILFLVAAAETGGFGMTDQKAAAIYGLYTAGVYLFALPGGWIADRILGQRNAVFLGGCIIAAGHFSMAIPTVASFYIGLALIVCGTGLLKPNVSAMVGDLYPEGGARRDAGFSVFYAGINTGAFIGPLICGFLGENVNWHIGFGAAGVGMVLGLIQYRLGARYLGDAGQRRTEGDRSDAKSSAVRGPPDRSREPGRRRRPRRASSRAPASCISVSRGSPGPRAS